MQDSPFDTSRRDPNTPKGPYYGWVVVGLALIGAMGLSTPSLGLPILYPFIKIELNLSRAEVGLITSAISGGGILTAFLGGMLIDALGVRRVTVVMLGITGLAMALFMFPKSFSAVLALGICIGMVQGPGAPALGRALMDWVPDRTRGLAVSIQQTGVPITGAVGAAILPVLAIAAGWRVAAVALGGIIVVISGVFLTLYRDAPRYNAGITKINLNALSGFIRDRGLMMATIWGSTYATLYFIIIIYTLLFMVERLNMPPVVAGSYLAGAQMGSIAARVLWGASSDFLFGARRIIVLAIIGILTTIGLIGMSLLRPGTPEVMVFLVVVMLGVTALSYPGVLITLVGELANREQVGTAFGTMTTISRCSQIVITPLFGLMVDLTGSYSIGWISAAVLALAATVILVAFGREPRDYKTVKKEPQY